MVVSFRASVVERAGWELAAACAGLSLSGWVRRSLDAAAELERALLREAERAG